MKFKQTLEMLLSPHHQENEAKKFAELRARISEMDEDTLADLTMQIIASAKHAAAVGDGETALAMHLAMMALVPLLRQRFEAIKREEARGSS